MSGQERETKPVVVPQTSQNGAVAKRVAPFPGVVALEEQIVNSSRVLPLVIPRLNGPPGTAIVSIKPASAFVSRRNDLERAGDDMARQKSEAFSPAEPTSEIKDGREIPIRFWPKFSGTHEADISILMRWPAEGDAMEMRTVRVYGHARKLDEAPAHPLGDTRSPVGHVDDKEVPVADPSGVAPVHVATLDHVAGEAKDAVGSVARHQRDGLKEAEGEIGAYARRPPEAPWWESLAEFALSLTIAGVAASLSKKIAGSLSLSKYTEIGFADSVKEAMKAGGKRAFLSRGKHAEADVSSDTKLAFFTIQHRTLSMFEDENVWLVQREHRRLGHQLRSDPSEAISKMQALRDGLRGVAPFAEQEQGAQTRRGWMSLLGRALNGTEHVQVNGELRQTTDLHHAKGDTRGILRIRVEDGKVTKASIAGLSQPAADRLLKQNLSRESIPLLIESRTGRDGSLYTRDEVGRVRMAFIRDGEEDGHHHAQRVVDEVLSKSLSAWGLSRIETDAQETGIGQ